MKKRLEEIFNLFANGVNDLSYLVVLIIFETINVRTNDRRRIMPFVASVSSCSWEGIEVCFGELFDSLSSIALDIFLVQFIFES